MPITRYIVDKVMLPQIAEDIENVMISKAKYVADSQKTEDTMDGFETILVEAKKSLDKQMRFFNTTKNLLEAVSYTHLFWNRKSTTRSVQSRHS